MKADDGRAVVIITEQSELEKQCAMWAMHSVLALDTEFIRTNTFYPKPGLFQLADDDAIYLIDPLEIDEWACFIDLLECSDTTFVLHSASEDLALLLSAFGILPAKLFDTQLAAAYLGLGFSLSYQALVKTVLDIDVAKDETRSDWLQRPLSESQLSYAASDVCYLVQVSKILETQLQDRGVLEWFREDAKSQLVTADEMENPSSWELAYAQMSNAWRLADKQLRNLQILCYWRETEARRRNKPRSWIVKDMELFALADEIDLDEQVEVSDIRNVAVLSGETKRKHAGAILDILQDPPALASINKALLSPPLPPRYRNLVKQWRKVVTDKADALQIAPELLARKKWLHELLRGTEQTGELNWQSPIAGWRQNLLEAEFTQLFEKA